MAKGVYQALIMVSLMSYEYHTQAVSLLDSNFGLDVFQLAQKYGYPCEKHEIVTEDGYILQMERISHGREINMAQNHRPPVLMVPGLLTGSVSYANFGPQKSLAFILADHGFDVWLLNYRGTTYSRKHKYLNPDVDKKEYWNYSFVEIGAYDLPAAIDKVLLETQQTSLFYIGHSLGNADVFALLTDKPEYNQKIKLVVALAPVLHLSNTKDNIFTVIEHFHSEIQFQADLLHSYEVFPHSFLLAQTGRVFCGDLSPFQILCENIFLFIVGYTPEEFDKSQMPVIISTTPAGSSLKSVLHSSQMYRTGRFAKYDYGPKDNLVHYGEVIPPLYNVSKITTPIAMFYGEKDALISVTDMEIAARMLPSLFSKTLVKGFNHIDFIWGIDAPTMVYPEIITLMKNFLRS